MVELPESYIYRALEELAGLPVADAPNKPIFKVARSATEPVNAVLNVNV